MNTVTARTPEHEAMTVLAQTMTRAGIPNALHTTGRGTSQLDYHLRDSDVEGVVFWDNGEYVFAHGVGGTFISAGTNPLAVVARIAATS